MAINGASAAECEMADAGSRMVAGRLSCRSIRFCADGMVPLFEAPALAGYRVTFHCRGYGDSDRAEPLAVHEWSVGPDGVAGVKVPTLSVVNCEERWAGFGETHAVLQASLPDCEGVILPILTHLLQIADADPVATAIAAFLERHPLH